ncbi:MAG: hypothetical protein ACI4PL_02385 [Faecousia sp.]
MEDEKFITGYCRQLDQRRVVTAVTEDGCLTEVDCCYPDCVHAPACPIAAELRSLEAPQT